MERAEEQEDSNEATPAMGIFSPANSQDDVIVHMTEAKLHSLVLCCSNVVLLSPLIQFRIWNHSSSCSCVMHPSKLTQVWCIEQITNKSYNCCRIAFIPTIAVLNTMLQQPSAKLEL